MVVEDDLGSDPTRVAGGSVVVPPITVTVTVTRVDITVAVPRVAITRSARLDIVEIQTQPRQAGEPGELACGRNAYMALLKLSIGLPWGGWVWR